MSKEEVYNKVSACLMDALGVDEDEIQPDSSLTGDLGAESIDFLDIVFRLEKTFGIKIPRGGLFPENILSNPEFVQDGRVTEKGLAELRSTMPHLNIDKFAKDPNVNNFADLFTVDMLVNYVSNRLN
ncbi:MAG: acyl carrier protein [Candidatus Auribacterota bacterium]|jgi:acyl carrier protein